MKLTYKVDVFQLNQVEIEQNINRMARRGYRLVQTVKGSNIGSLERESVLMCIFEKEIFGDML